MQDFYMTWLIHVMDKKHIQRFFKVQITPFEWKIRRSSFIVSNIIINRSLQIGPVTLTIG